MNWVEKEMPIGDIDQLLKDGYEIEVDSPDGWVGVNTFVDKGEHEEYFVETENGYTVRCNSDHLFKTPLGEWISAGDLEIKCMHFKQNRMGGHTVSENSLPKIMTKDGVSNVSVNLTGQKIPIVDIQVNHDNHRYYTAGIESHNTGVGKSLAMCHFAAANLMDNKNVLYITMEMAEEKIAERIDANLLNIKIQDLENAPKDYYTKQIEKVKSRTLGKLIVKEYPTSSAHAGHFRHLLNELKIKKRFVPDMIYIDYINICASSRVKTGSNVNSYTYIKSIAEEIRGLAVEYDVPIFSATQVTRSGFNNSDVELTDTSECIYAEEEVTLIDGSKKKIKDVKVGDQITSNDRYKTVHMVHHSKLKQCYEIKLESGKTIIVSAEHVFPTKRGRISIESGMLSVGDYLNVEKTNAN